MKKSSLERNTTDFAVSALKGPLGDIPLIGSTISEVASHLIPNQRIDRIADFALKLSKKIEEHDRVLIQHRLIEPEGTDILEEALWQSARALSDERRNYIASLMKNGLTREEINLTETKRLFSILSQLNDHELILLYSFAGDVQHRKKTIEEFGEILEPVEIFIGVEQEQLDKHAISENMGQHLIQLDLLLPRYPPFKKGELPEFDSNTGKFKCSSYEVSLLGLLLLKNIDLLPEA